MKRWAIGYANTNDDFVSVVANGSPVEEWFNTYTYTNYEVAKRECAFWQRGRDTLHKFFLVEFDDEEV